MPNLFQNLSFDPNYLRMQNMYGNMGMDMPEQGGIAGLPNFNTDQNPPLPDATPNPLPPQATDSEAPYDVNGRMAQLYHPTTEAENRFNQLASNYPVEHEPSRLRRLGAALLTGGLNFAQDTGPGRGVYNPMFGMDVGKAFLDEPYNKDVEAWKNQIGPSMQAANIEREQNVNDRQMAYQQISAELRDQAEKHKAANDETKAHIAQQRADAYDFKARNPGMKLVIAKGGNIMAMDAQGQLHDTGIDSGTLSDADKMALTQDNRMEQIGAQGANAANVAGIRTGGAQTDTVDRAWQVFQKTDPITGETKTYRYNPILNKPPEEVSGQPMTKVGPSSTGSKVNASQDRIARYNKATEAFNTHPEWRQFINLGVPGANDFKMSEPPRQDLMFGRGHNPAYDEYQKAVKFIYGEQKQETPNPSSTNTSNVPSRAAGAGPLAGTGGGGRGNPTPQTKAPVAPKGWKYVPKPGGGWTAVPDTGGE